MLHDQILLVLSLLFAIGVLHMLSTKLDVAYPILLVLGGLAISLIPGTPRIHLEPDLVFLIFLPPLLYEAAWYTSWKDFWRLRRAIGLQAFGLVIFTSIAVAFAAHALIPDFPLALGFVLGGIISPPDAVAATSILHGLRVPKDAVTILEGESLINDASSLIVFRFALAAVMTGHFAWSEVGTQFLWVSGVGIAIGLAIAQVAFLIHRRLPTTPSIDVALTLVTPYLMYLAAESVYSSGVLAVVAGGLYLSYRSHDFLPADSRVQGTAVWSVLVFLMNGFVFILIGLQLPMIVEGLDRRQVVDATWYAVAISFLAVTIRMAWVFPAAYTSRLRSSVRRARRAPNWKLVFLVGWAGMRGVVSLASALAIPLSLADGSTFPQRNLILYITFIVILATLVLQGLSLPLVIRWLRFAPDEKHGSHEEQRHAMSLRMAGVALAHLDSRYEAECRDVERFRRLRAYYQELTIPVDEEGAEISSGEIAARYRRALLEVVQAQKKAVIQSRREGGFDYEVTREMEEELDLEEARLLRAGG